MKKKRNINNNINFKKIIFFEMITIFNKFY